MDTKKIGGEIYKEAKEDFDKAKTKAVKKFYEKPLVWLAVAAAVVLVVGLITGGFIF